MFIFLSFCHKRQAMKGALFFVFFNFLGWVPLVLQALSKSLNCKSTKKKVNSNNINFGGSGLSTTRAAASPWRKPLGLFMALKILQDKTVNLFSFFVAISISTCPFTPSLLRKVSIFRRTLKRRVLREIETLDGLHTQNMQTLLSF